MRPLPWLYPYLEEPDSTRLGEPVLRPFLWVSFAGDEEEGIFRRGLVDTGADSILASDLVADRLGLDLEDNDGETTHAVGGSTLVARYKTVTMRLHTSDRDPDTTLEWDAPVGFVAGWPMWDLVLLGSVGFLDRWTVTASRFAQALAIEDQKTFDDRFGIVLAC